MNTPRAAAVCLLIALLLPTIPCAHAQQTIAQYRMSDKIFCRQDIDALDKSVQLTVEQRTAVESLFRLAQTKVVAFSGRLSRESAELQEKMGQQKLTPEEREENARKERIDAAKSAIAAGDALAAIEREALADVRTLLTPEQIERGWQDFERYRRRLLAEWAPSVTRAGHTPESFLRPLKLGKADSDAIADILSAYQRELDILLLARMRELERIYKELAETGEHTPGSFERPEMMTDKIRRLHTSVATKIESALSDPARDQFMRQRVGLQFGIDRVGKDDWTSHIIRLPSLTPEQKERMDAIIAKGDSALFQMLLSGVRACDDLVLRGQTTDEIRHAYHDCYRRATAIISDARKEVRGVLRSSQVEELDAEIARQNNGPDPFGSKRSPDFDSPWLAGPEKSGK